MFKTRFHWCAALLALIPVGAKAQARAAEDEQPLFVVQISEATLNRLIDEKIERESDVNDQILGAHVVGTATTTGKPKLHLVESETGPTVKVLFSGATVSRTAGHRSPVVIYSHTQTNFAIEKVVAVEQLGKVTEHPTEIHSTTAIVTDNITTNRRGLLGRIVLRRAWQAVAAQEPEARAIAQQRTEQRLVKAFDEGLEKRIENLRKRISLRVLAAAVVPSNVTPAYRSVTKGGYLTVAAYAKSPGTRVVEVNLPKLTVPEQPVQIWLHKQVVGENAASIGEKVDAARQWLALSTAVVALGVNEGQRGARWTTVDDWSVVQLNGAN